MKQGIRHLLLCCFVFVASVASADHTLPAGSIDRLTYDSRNLDSAVRYSSLHYQVKQAVARFTYEVAAFSHCVHGIAQDRDHDLVPESCEYNMNRVHQAYYPVQRYLYDTYYDYPQVYNRWTRVDYDMRSLPHPH